MRYCSAVKRHELLIHETTWVNLKGIVLNEINHCQKVLFYMISFIWHSQKDRTIMVEMGIARSEGRGGCDQRESVMELWC